MESIHNSYVYEVEFVLYLFLLSVKCSVNKKHLFCHGFNIHFVKELLHLHNSARAG